MSTMKTSLFKRHNKPCHSFEPAQEPEAVESICFHCGHPRGNHSAKDNERTDAVAMLRKYLKPGDTVYCVLRSVSKSGMSRRIDFYALVTPNGDPAMRTTDKPYLQYLSGYMSKLGIGSWHPDKNGLRVSGCGMDMGFHCVYTLSRYLFKGERKCEKCGYKGPCGTCPKCVVPTHETDCGCNLRSEWI